MGGDFQRQCDKLRGPFALGLIRVPGDALEASAGCLWGSYPAKAFK